MEILCVILSANSTADQESNPKRPALVMSLVLQELPKKLMSREGRASDAEASPSGGPRVLLPPEPGHPHPGPIWGAPVASCRLDRVPTNPQHRSRDTVGPVEGVSQISALGRAYLALLLAELHAPVATH
ncbi:Hypothetical protein NTJ_00504 [Nesidiocoris tenuis]|uniref:Uncharacterized protein n=1 Tax=Nesidiocoris tenuis TaxID=355587 RepID=A0ABN7A6A0_9HEMI|nr:Hypothetical protein NTJ_00504 [Nesidiocoris tenuis]